LLPSPDAGPEALYVRNALLDQLELALDELPEEQREAPSGVEEYAHGAKTGVECSPIPRFTDLQFPF
jgi:hypothetical protein